MKEGLSPHRYLQGLIKEGEESALGELDESDPREKIVALPEVKKNLLLRLGICLADADNSLFDDRTLAGRFMNHIMRFVNANKGGCFAKGPTGEIITLFARHGIHTASIEDFSRTQIASVLENGEILNSVGLRALAARSSIAVAPSVEVNTPGPYVIVPLMVPPGESQAGRVFAAMCLVREDGELDFSDELVFVELVGKFVAPLLHRSQMHQAALNHIARLTSEKALLLEQKEFLEQELRKTPPIEFVGQSSAAAKKLLEMIGVAARSRSAPVLIVGETGSGKREVARALHAMSSRRGKPFVTRNCAAFSREGLLDSELFGHRKGAFTNAHEARDGVFRTATGGTLFLDEITEASSEVFGKLLRAVEEKVITPVGSDDEISVDIRVIAATNRNIEQLVEEKKFPRDLFYRLNVFMLRVPPLRERRDDIPELANHFLQELAEEEGIRDQKGFTAGAMKLMLEHEWPGNVRELRNLVQKLVVITQGKRIGEELIETFLAPAVAGDSREGPIKKEQLLDALDACGWKVETARQRLNISKGYIYYLMRQWNIKRPDAAD